MEFIKVEEGKFPSSSSKRIDTRLWCSLCHRTQKAKFSGGVTLKDPLFNAGGFYKWSDKRKNLDKKDGQTSDGEDDDDFDLYEEPEDVWAFHSACVVFAKAFRKRRRNTDFEVSDGLKGFELKEVLKEVEGSQNRVCQICGNYNANFSCSEPKCGVRLHFSCLKNQEDKFEIIFREKGGLEIYCENHFRNKKANQEESRKITCQECKAVFSTDSIQETLLKESKKGEENPQDLKCPKCEDSKNFGKVCVLGGIFIPGLQTNLLLKDQQKPATSQSAPTATAAAFFGNHFLDQSQPQVEGSSVFECTAKVCIAPGGRGYTGDPEDGDFSIIGCLGCVEKNRHLKCAFGAVKFEKIKAAERKSQKAANKKGKRKFLCVSCNQNGKGQLQKRKAEDEGEKDAKRMKFTNADVVGGVMDLLVKTAVDESKFGIVWRLCEPIVTGISDGIAEKFAHAENVEMARNLAADLAFSVVEKVEETKCEAVKGVLDEVLKGCVRIRPQIIDLTEEEDDITEIEIVDNLPQAMQEENVHEGGLQIRKDKNSTVKEKRIGLPSGLGLLQVRKDLLVASIEENNREIIAEHPELSRGFQAWRQERSKEGQEIRGQSQGQGGQDPIEITIDDPLEISETPMDISEGPTEEDPSTICRSVLDEILDSSVVTAVRTPLDSFSDILEDLIFDTIVMTEAKRPAEKDATKEEDGKRPDEICGEILSEIISKFDQ